MSAKPVVVVGDGWAALGSIGFLLLSGHSVEWVVGSGTRILPPLASLENGPGVEIWKKLANEFGVFAGEPRRGSWIKEFRNKAFREPPWSKAPTLEDRQEVKNEVLWTPERRFVGAFEARFELTIGEMEEEIRKALDSGKFPVLKKREGLPLVGFKKEKGQVTAVLLGSGEEIPCEKVIYADRWSLLVGMEGVPKPVSFLRKRESVGVLQAVMAHDIPVGLGVLESFYATLHRTAGEEFERHVWGHFSSDGKRSVWSICLPAEEVEDNHEIAKKLRKMKTTLDRIFEGSDIIPQGKVNFGETVTGEQVRFEEEVVFATGELEMGWNLPGLEGVSFLTDGYGASAAMAQVGSLLGVQLGSSDAQAENVNLPEASPDQS